MFHENFSAKTFVCAVPRAIWEQHLFRHARFHDISAYANEAIRLEQQLHERGQQDDLIARYQSCCKHIAALADSRYLTPFETVDQFRETLRLGYFPMSTLSAYYSGLLAQMLSHAPRELRLGCTFFPPDTVADHLVGFRRLLHASHLAHHPDIQRRSRLFSLACEFRCGVIETQLWL